MKTIRKSLIFVSVLLIAQLLNPLAVMPSFSSGGQVAYARTLGQGLNDPDTPGKVYFPLTMYSRTGSASAAEWPMVAANPERTSWSPSEVSGDLHVEWYRPIEAYISQNVQIIAGNNMIYISTAKGLYALDAATGNTAWRYDTELPMGNSPTLASGVLYVGGYDRKIHALNAITGSHLWSFDGAKAGYDTNPLVVEGKVIVGNRDGNLYAIGAHGTSNQGRLIWSFQSGGPIHFSPAYKSGIVYFAANDNYAYAVRADSGALVWKSPEKLPGDGYHSFWPVVYQDKVIFSAALSYRMGLDPGTSSVEDDNGTPYGHYRAMEREDIFFGAAQGDIIGNLLPAQDWSHGYPTLDATRLTEYLESNPTPNENKYKPWRRTFVILNTSNGAEFTFDSDHDGRPEYMPIVYWGTNSGNRYPPVVGPDNILYQNNLYTNTSDAQGKVMGWNFGTQYLSVIGGQAAIAEPQALSMGGNIIYRSLCCDRVASFFDIRTNGNRSQTLWSYDLFEAAPGYDEMWTILPGWPRLQGWYKGNTNSINGIYHNHGDQNPIIPYGGRLFVHRSNAIIAFGPGAARGKQPLLTIQSASDNVSTPSTTDLRQRLEAEVQKMINAGHLRPGYYNNGQFTHYKEFADYFDNPGDTLYALSIAYPHLSTAMQAQTKAYLASEFATYFDPTMYASIGWADGAAREAMPLSPEIQAAMSTQGKAERSTRWSWTYPPHNFYAMWKYAQIVPENAGRIYDLAKSVLVVPVPSVATSEYFQEKPYELNAYVAGYIGLLNLQDLAGRSGTDAALRTSVTNELNRLQQLRVTIFEKDTPYVDNFYHKRHLNIARNFIFMVPELGDYLRRNDLSEVQEALTEYEYVAPYWFVSRYESTINEGAMSVLYNYSALFQARAHILTQSRAVLTKYLDVPAFERGDLFYIQNLVTCLNAP